MPIDGLAWMAGCRVAERGDAGSGEMGLAPVGSGLFGMICESSDDATLVGRIEGQQDGRARGIHFPMKRVACPAAAR